MAGFGIVSLTQTAIGSLLDQRAVVLYEQPEVDYEADVSSDFDYYAYKASSELWGNQFRYTELFSGLLAGTNIERIANVAGVNPYGITYLEAKVDMESELCEHPIENGTIITDSSIILPVNAEVVVAMPTFYAEEIYHQMKDIFTKKNKKIILQTKYGLYTDLVLQNISYEIEPSTIDRARFTLTLREVQEVMTSGEFSQIAKPKEIANSSDANTENTGSQVAE